MKKIIITCDYAPFNELCNERLITPKDVANTFGFSTLLFSDWQKEIQMPDPCQLYAIARYFKVPMETFITTKEFDDEDIKGIKEGGEDTD